jgi:prepilin-type N-terminal cleavage/methylation domain-containing protein
VKVTPFSSTLSMRVSPLQPVVSTAGTESQQMKRPRTGFTLIELLVVIAIIAILAAILFPVFAQAREKARQSGCLSNLKQIGTALMMYTQDYDEAFPCTWYGSLWPTTGVRSVSLSPPTPSRPSPGRLAAAARR